MKAFVTQPKNFNLSHNLGIPILLHIDGIL